jgi:DNA-directed RNA polymerase subunit RPC12/RpoP
MTTTKPILVSNFIVTEKWDVQCPYCLHEQDAPFNETNPMEPMELYCESCGLKFILTYERD